MHVYRYEIMNTLNLLHPRLSPHRLCGTSCTWAHEPKYAIYHKAIENHHLALLRIIYWHDKEWCAIACAPAYIPHLV